MKRLYSSGNRKGR